MGEATAPGAQIGVHPTVGIHFWAGCMTLGGRPGTRGALMASPHPHHQAPWAGSFGCKQHHGPYGHPLGHPSKCSRAFADRHGRHGHHRTRA